ncbi:hypothetical protein V3C99_014730 [Haemonchus contortus]|uniref:Transmembrane protein n=1 Tax=Haemonchus contortus TaxID=6289 RepID=A0A7I5ECA3_HAECO
MKSGMALYFSLLLLLIASMMMCSAIPTVSNADVDEKSLEKNLSIGLSHGFDCC